MNARPERTLDDWLAHIRSVHFRSIDMSLERVREVLERLVPAPSFKIIAVAGTNGKGSCAAMLAAVLEAGGRRTGLYTSPHLARFNERIRVDGREAGDALLCRAFEQVDSRRGNVPLTYFEFATLAAAWIFHQASMEIAVMEVGMGGRLDAVNALAIEAALITNVELDHVRWLGRDREAIGGEKARIMRSGRVAVFNHASVPGSVRAYATEIGADLLVAGRDYRVEAADGGWRWLGPAGEDWSLPAPSLPGAVQRDNAAGVLALLTRCGLVDVGREAAATGLVDARVRGRCEIVSRAPQVMIDVAHNPSALAALKEQLAAHPVSGRTTAVFGMLKDKDPVEVVRAMDGWIDAWCLATIEDERGETAAALADAIRTLVHETVHSHDSAAQAYECARRHSTGSDRILAFGSFHIAGDILVHTTRPS